VIKHPFGPGNHSHYVVSRKDNLRVLEDIEIQDDEEGLDEKEPEKAICADKALFVQCKQKPEKPLTFNQIFKQHLELIEKEQKTNNNSASKKNKKKRKKRQKAKQQKQEQKILVRNGIVMDEGQDTEIYSMMIPIDEMISDKSQDINNPQLRNPFEEIYPNEFTYTISEGSYKGNEDDFPLVC